MVGDVAKGRSDRRVSFEISRLLCGSSICHFPVDLPLLSR